MSFGKAAAQTGKASPVLLGVFFGICLLNKLSVRGVLTQASYYQSQGAEVGKSTKCIGGNYFRVDLKNKYTWLSELR